MNKKQFFNQKIEEAFNSINDIKRATPKRFLLTRINARLSNAQVTVWEKAGWFIGRPAIAISGLIMIILINLSVIVFNRTESFTSAAEQSVSVDELSYSLVTIYDNETTEP